MKVAVIQMDCKTYDKKANFQIASGLIEKAGEAGARLILLPELFNTGYCSTEKDWELSEYVDGETEKFLKKYCKKYSCSIMAGFVEKSNVDGLTYNSLMYVTPDKDSLSYKKMYLWGAEKNRFIKGDELTVWECDGIKVSPNICFEVGFSENSKIEALNGANILCFSSAFGMQRLYAWELATRARALETGCYVLASNHSATEADIEFCGHSRIINPMGDVIAEAQNDNDVIIADIDLDMVAKQRDAIPYLRDINTEMVSEYYSLIKK